MQAETAKKIKDGFNKAESVFLPGFLSSFRFFPKFHEATGFWGILFLPVLDFARLVTYAMRDEKRRVSLLFYGLKFLAHAAGAALVVTSLLTANPFLLTLGFGLMVGMAGLGFLRNTDKFIFYRMWDQNRKPDKAEKNLLKMIVGALITLGFGLITFVPPLMPVGWGLVMASTGMMAIWNVNQLTGGVRVPVYDVKGVINGWENSNTALSGIVTLVGLFIVGLALPISGFPVPLSVLSTMLIVGLHVMAAGLGSMVLPWLAQKGAGVKDEEVKTLNTTPATPTAPADAPAPSKPITSFLYSKYIERQGDKHPEYNKQVRQPRQQKGASA